MYHKRLKRDLTKWDTVPGRKLLEVFSTAQEHGFMKEFLDDLLIESEFKQLSSRIEAVHLLLMGAPYTEIQKETGLSPKVIARISKKMDDKKGGLDLVMRKLYPRGYRYYE